MSPNKTTYDIHAPIITEPGFGGPSDEYDMEVSVCRQMPLAYQPPLCVTTRSPLSLRRAVYQIAKYFRREFRFDFLQYDYTDEEASARAYLFEAVGNLEAWPRSVMVGACCFRWREWSNVPHGWALQWVWLHPYARGRGILAGHWPYFRQRFGDFHVEGPLSPAMAAFLARVENKPDERG